MTDESKTLMKVLEWVIDIDSPAILASVAAERNQHPELTNKQLACNAFSQARWKATYAGHGNRITRESLGRPSRRDN